MKLQLDFQVPSPSSKMKHGDSIVLLGSCFSDNLAPKFEQAGFKVLSNPLGTIFHPQALSNGIRAAFDDFKANSIQRDDLWFDWRASGSIYGTFESQLNHAIKSKLDQLREGLVQAKMVIVTFGTAWGYQLDSGEVVANCHKMPQSNFIKQLTDLDAMKLGWEQTIRLIKEVNPAIEFTFTVSPVRHVKDGLVENNRSKSRLIQLCEALSEHGNYFPSYELVIDVLRDYRFYEADLVHPNAQAIDFVWEHAQSFFFSTESQEMIKEIAAVNRMRSHKPLYPESKAAIEFEENLKRKMEALSNVYPEIYWKE